MWFFLQAICKGVKPFCESKGMIIIATKIKTLKATWESINWISECLCKHVSDTDQCPRVGFGPFVQQYFGHAVVAAVCCHMQRGKVVQCDIIDLCVVLQKLLDAVHVVPLCCHVDWRQAILQNKSVDSLIHCKTGSNCSCRENKHSEQEAASRVECTVSLCVTDGSHHFYLLTSTHWFAFIYNPDGVQFIFKRSEDFSCI